MVTGDHPPLKRTIVSADWRMAKLFHWLKSVNRPQTAVGHRQLTLTLAVAGVHRLFRFRPLTILRQYHDR